jgi:hypothetical protein
VRGVVETSRLLRNEPPQALRGRRSREARKKGHTTAVGLFKHVTVSDSESLVDHELPIPQPSDRDLLVRLEAVSINSVDARIRSAKETIESSLAY